jgi:hypothetical protein
VSGSLLILSIAAAAMVALLTSTAIGGVVPWLDRLALALSPRDRARFWLGVSMLPAALGFLAVIASFLPAIGWGHDHCLAHGAHHPHLCPNHVGAAPSLALIAIAGLAVFRVAQVSLALARGLWLSRATALALAEAAERRDGLVVLSAEEPQAFVLGALRPRVYASTGLLALGNDIVEPVVSHERAHARRRDLLWRAICPVLAAGHWPAVSAALRRRLATAQELAADVEAAAALPDGRLRLASALVTLARLVRTPAPGLAFSDGDLVLRVRALLEPPRQNTLWPLRLIAGAVALLPIGAALSHELVHHGLETLLGALG